MRLTNRADDAFEADQTQDDAFAAGQEAQDLLHLSQNASAMARSSRQIELALEELSVTKGSVATAQRRTGAIRNGELYVSSPNAADVQAISFAPFDTNGQPTRPANTDIIEFVESSAM